MSWAWLTEGWVVSMRFPLLVHFAADRHLFSWPLSKRPLFSWVTISGVKHLVGSEAPNSTIRLGLACRAALEAKVGGGGFRVPLPWAEGWPLGGGGCARCGLVCRPDTVLDSAVMVLLSSKSSALS